MTSLNTRLAEVAAHSVLLRHLGVLSNTRIQPIFGLQMRFCANFFLQNNYFEAMPGLYLHDVNFTSIAIVKRITSICFGFMINAGQ